MRRMRSTLLALTLSVSLALALAPCCIIPTAATVTRHLSQPVPSSVASGTHLFAGDLARRSLPELRRQDNDMMDVDTTGDTDEDEDDDDTDDYDTEEDTEADDDDTDDDDIDSVASSSGPLHFPYIDDDVRGFEFEADTARSSDARHASSPPPPRLPHSARASASVSATTKRPPLVNPRTICPSSHPDHGIIVIGAGISGLATARTIRHLAHNHCHIRILEARQRIGGRIHTMREGPWRGLDMGAGWIHEFAGGNPMMSLVRQLGLRWRYVGGDSSFVGGTRVLLMDPVTGRRVTVLKRVISFLLFQKLHRLLESDFKHRTDLSLEQGLAIAYERLRFVPWQRRILRWYIDVVYAGDYAALVGKLSLSAAVKERSMRLRGGDVVVSDGYGTITEALARGLNIELGVAVTEIDYGSGSVTVTAKDGKQYHARKVVVTLPHGVLKSNDVRFTPPLPARHVQALNHLEMGVLNRIILKYDRPLWPADKYTFGWLPMVEDAPYFFSMAVNPKMEGRDVDGAILQFMVGGDSYAAMERLPRSTIISELDQLLRRSFVTAPGARLIDATFSDWKHDPFAQGSYAYEMVGATHADRQQLSEPLLAHAFHADRDGGTAVVYFAGEHTDMDGEDGTTHAAYLSGIRAARRIFMPTDGDAGHPYFRMPVKKDAVAAGPPVA